MAQANARGDSKSTSKPKPQAVVGADGGLTDEVQVVATREKTAQSTPTPSHSQL